MKFHWNYIVFGVISMFVASVFIAVIYLDEFHSNYLLKEFETTF